MLSKVYCTVVVGVASCTFVQYVCTEPQVLLDLTPNTWAPLRLSPSTARRVVTRSINAFDSRIDTLATIWLQASLQL